jgi:AraC-like DNA-binding protein
MTDLNQAKFNFNIFRLESLCKLAPKGIQHGRRDYYKISLIRGDKVVHYGDQSFEIKGSTLIFFKPDTPYSMIQTNEHHSGIFCVFPASFFNHYVEINKYPLFQDITNAYVTLNAEQDRAMENIFLRMEEEFQGEYQFKNDIIRNYILELIHFTMRAKRFDSMPSKSQNGSSRLADLFINLLEKQFPIDAITQQLNIRNPKDFATALNVHVNHLNKVLHDVTGKSTTVLIKERVIKEARSMLRFTDWTINQISWCLGYEDTSNFINLFKRATSVTPNDFRRQSNV